MLKDRKYLVSQVGCGMGGSNHLCGVPCDLLAWRLQHELELTKDVFRDKYGEMPRKDDLTILVPRIDDPTEQVNTREALDNALLFVFIRCDWVSMQLHFSANMFSSALADFCILS
jgi:hypothetical protein